MKTFHNIAGHKPRRSVFENSYYKVMDVNLCEIIPVMCDLFLPGDLVKISAEALVRAMPMVAPIMHRIDLKVDYYACPIRPMWPKPDYKDRNGDSLGYTQDVSSWEEFITGGVTGKLEPVQPKWNPQNTDVYSYWDYFGNPLDSTNVGFEPNAWQIRALNFVYNEYFRDQNFEDPVDLDDETIKIRKMEKDYFTSALQELQRGTAPSVPFVGNLPIRAEGMDYTFGVIGGLIEGTTNTIGSLRTTPAQQIPIGNTGNQNTVEIPKLYADLSESVSFDVNDMRYIFAIQRHMERSMRAGSRLTEHVLAHWGVHNGDARLQRPEYIGGIRSPVIVSEVLQTSSTDGTSPQGNLAGHGIATSQTRVGTYYCKEHMVIIGLLSLMPKPVYQQGINRQWLYETRFDYPTPELVNLGEQEIFNCELVSTSDETWNRGIFGYQGRYDEHRVKQNQIVGRLRSTAPVSLEHWHLGRNFDYNALPALNKEFLEYKDDQRYSAYKGNKGWLITYGNRIRRVAPLPIVGTPGRIDHN